jgi:hypothetical protein
MKKMIKIYQVRTKMLVQTLTLKKLSLNILQQEFTTNHKDSPKYSSENFTTLKYLGTTLVNLNYNIFMIILEVQYIPRMHVTIHSSIYFRNSYTKSYMLFYFVCHTKGGKIIEGVVRRRKIENKWTLETGSHIDAFLMFIFSRMVPQRTHQ